LTCATVVEDISCSSQTAPLAERTNTGMPRADAIPTKIAWMRHKDG
jgi:hypothetical protein